MSANQVSDKIKIYAEQRAAVSLQGMWVLIGTPILLALARSPDFKLKDVFGLVEGAFHNGYVGAYGHFIILVLGVRYAFAISENLRLYHAVQWDLRNESRAVDSQRTEAFLLRAPFSSYRFTGQGVLYRFAPLTPLFVALIGYVVFLINYFRFHEAGREKDWLSDLLLGKPGQGGFHATWDLKMASTPWINAPVQTWLGIAGLVYLMFVVVSSCKKLTHLDVPTETEVK